MLVMLTELLSGLALFLFGMKFMSEGLQKAAGDKMRVILDRVTKNRFIAVIFGAIFTAIIQSSGATTVMEVSFVNAGLLTLEQSVGITFGANIGTTITAQLVSLKLTAIAPYIIFAGACLMMFGNKPITRKISLHWDNLRDGYYIAFQKLFSYRYQTYQKDGYSEMHNPSRR